MQITSYARRDKIQLSTPVGRASRFQFYQEGTERHKSEFSTCPVHSLSSSVQRGQFVWNADLRSVPILTYYRNYLLLLP